MQAITVIIESSAKHCHVTRETLDALFGKGFELEVKKMLSQPGQFATPHRVTLVGPRASTSIAIVGPCRKVNQVELSLTDQRSLGITAPIRESGDVKGSAGCKLIGPCGEVELSEGAIIAKRHIHLTPEDAEKFGIKDKQIVKLKTTGERALVFDEVVARVHREYATFVHLDFDEYNAAGLKDPDPTGEIILD